MWWPFIKKESNDQLLLDDFLDQGLDVLDAEVNTGLSLLAQKPKQAYTDLKTFLKKGKDLLSDTYRIEKVLLLKNASRKDKEWLEKRLSDIKKERARAHPTATRR